MKYYLMLADCHIGTFKTLEKATDAAYDRQNGCNHDLDLHILEVFSDHEMRCSKDYYFKEKKF